MSRRSEVCHYCGKALHGGNRTRDHIVPKSKGGSNAQWNIVLSCARCNQAKADSESDCACPTCQTARLNWMAGMRSRYVPGATLGTSVFRVHDVAARWPEDCLLACRMLGCAFPKRCYRARVDNGERG